VAASRGGQRGARGSLGLGEDRARRPRDLLGGIGRERRVGDAASEHLQHRHVRHAASLVVAQFVGNDHDEPPLVDHGF
jgi:hypothetical protein